MKVAICDDNEGCIASIEKNLGRFGVKSINCDSYRSGEELLGEYKTKGTYDLVFLDVEMGGIDGIKVGERIREIDNNVVIVFVTSYPSYAPECFGSMPFRFLVKPIDEGKFDEMFCGAFKKISKRPKAYTFENNKEYFRLCSDDIIFCESKKHVISIKTVDGDFKINKPINELEKLFKDSFLCRVHRSFIVNLAYVQKISETEIKLRGADLAIPVGRSYKKQVKESYKKFIEGEIML